MATTTPKILIVGDAAVGKTALVHRLLTGTYSEGYAATLGAEVHPLSSEGHPTVNLWDIHGNPKLGMGKAYYTGAVVAVVCYSLGEKAEDVVKGFTQLCNTAIRNGGSGVQVILVGTKKDISTRCGKCVKLVEVSPTIPHILTSALTGEGVEELRAAIFAAVESTSA